LGLLRKPVANSTKFTVFTLNKDIRNNAKKLKRAPCHPKCGFSMSRNRLIWFIGVSLDCVVTFYETPSLYPLQAFSLFFVLYRVKKHARKAQSVFRYGLDYLRSLVTDLDLKHREFLLSLQFLSCT
jgi:hypothetical protein